MSKIQDGLGLVVAALVLPVLCAQEKPLTVDAMFATGYYSTTTRGDANQSLSFVPFGARLEVSGYVKSPDLLNFWVSPELNAGPQASEAGFEGGNGIRLRATVLRKLIPLTFRYTNVQVEDVYFGGLSQVSGYSLKNRNTDLGLTLELKSSHNLPSLVVDWGVSSVNSQAGIAGIPDYLSNGHHVNADSKWERGGWVLEGFLHYQEQQSNILEPLSGGTQFGSLDQTVTQYQGSARRGFWGDSELYVDGGSQSTSSLLFTLPIDLNTHYAGANLRLFQRRRVRTLVRANYSSNLASQLLAQSLGTLTVNGATVPDQSALQPYSYGVSSFDVSSVTNVTLGRGFGTYAGVERNQILSNQSAAVSAGYSAGSAGITYNRKLSWGSLSGEYGRELGQGSVTGQSGTIQGQTYLATAQKGSTGHLVIDAVLHGNDQTVHNAQPLSNHSRSLEGNVSDRLFGDISGQAGGGWQWGRITNSANEFRSGGYTAHAGISHPHLQFNASLNDINNNSIPLYDNLLGGLGGLGVATLLPGTLRIIPSDYRATSLSLHTTPVRKVEISAVWSHSKQHLDGVVSNNFQLLDVYVTYHFRRLQLQSGYIRFNQTFDLYPTTLRTRFYVRISRKARLL